MRARKHNTTHNPELLLRARGEKCNPSNQIKIGKNKNLLFYFILFMCARISQQQRLSYGDPFRTRFNSQSLCVCMSGKGRGRRFPSISH